MLFRTLGQNLRKKVRGRAPLNNEEIVRLVRELDFPHRVRNSNS